jgi:hypothetical protein
MSAIGSSDWWSFFVDNLNGLSAVAPNVPASLSANYQTLLANGATLYDSVTATASMDATTAANTIAQLAVPIQQWFQQTQQFALAIGSGADTVSASSQQGFAEAQSFFTSFSEDTTTAMSSLIAEIQAASGGVATAASALSGLASVPLWAWIGIGFIALLAIME